MKQFTLSLITISVLLILTGCTTSTTLPNESSLPPLDSAESSASQESAYTHSSIELGALDSNSMFTSRDYDASYDESTATKIQLGEDTIRITEEGVYILSGTLDNGQIIVELPAQDKVQLVLDQVTIHSASSAPIYIKSGDKVFITLAPSSTNLLSVSGAYEQIDDNNVDGVIFSKSDLTFNGTGSLSIQATYGHGIVGKDDVVFTGGTYHIAAQDHGICGNDSIRIADGVFHINSGKDGMQADHDDDPTLGYVYISNGSYSIHAQQDGISASSTLQIDGGDFSIASGGGFEQVLNIITKGEGPGNIPQVTDTLTESMKGLKGMTILLMDGIFQISSYEDAIHANDELLIHGGEFHILSGDDALHADHTVTIYDGTIVVEDAYEGIEGIYVVIRGGDITLNVLDDAINASETDGSITIEGGTIFLIASGDGVDSNGDFFMSGGTLVIDSNPIYSGGDGAIDITGSTQITGGSITDEKGNAINLNSSSRQR